MPSRLRSALVLAPVVVAALAGCEQKFPRAGEDGTGPDIAWVVSDQPVAWELVAESGPENDIHAITNPTEPAAYLCGTNEYNACRSHFQGTGFVVEVPRLCTETARQVGPLVDAFPSFELEVDDDRHSYAVPALPGIPSALYVTVGRPGTVTTGNEVWSGDVHHPAYVEPTFTVADRGEYKVALTCAAPGEDVLTAWRWVTFRGVVRHG